VSSARLTPFQRRFRAFFRGLARVVEALLTRTTISGREHIPARGPVIFASNHASTYDAVIFIAHLPPETELVGPGDFKLLFPAEHLIALAGIVRIKRAALDRESLKLMSGALADGMNLALFPEGGTWEKRLEDVKPGVAYLSQQQDVPIVPISLGGTYQVWSRIVRLQRPRIHIRFGEPLPPVQITDRRQRAQALQAASLALMQRIYEHLPAEDRARYDRAAHTHYRGRIVGQPVPPSLDETAFDVLAELVSKPNLVSPLLHNARLPLAPLMTRGRFFSASAFVVAAERLQSAFVGTFAGYLDYRLGSDKAAAADHELDAMRRLALAAHTRGQRLRFDVRTY
jgi:1-acyl-sn-glycerol-3-phosphate acyltransferase